MWVLFMLLLIRDDLVLMKWLWTYNPATAEKETAAADLADKKKDM